jgi:general secretion pathway protein D
MSVKPFLAAVLMMMVFGSVKAESISLNFSSVPLASFVKATYRGILNRDFVIAPDLLAQDRPISVSVKAIEPENVAQLVDGVLRREGVVSTFTDGVWTLSLAKDGGRVLGAADVGGLVAVRGDGGAVKPQADPLLLPADFDQVVYKPSNRKAEFLALSLNAVFPMKPAVAAGSVLVMSGSKDVVSKVKRLAEQLDAAAPKVRLSATFVEVSRTDTSNLGVSVIADVLGAQLGIKVGDTSNGGLTLKTGRFQAVIDALASDGRFKQVAAPTAVVDDNEKSQLSFGQSVPTISSTTLDRNGFPVQQVQYQQSGVLLSVQPVVLGSGRVNVAVDGQVSSFTPTTTGVNGSPTLNKRQVQTAVTVDDGELLLIGGLNDSREAASAVGLSFLPKSWRAGGASSSNTDLVLILAATVVR